MTRSDDNTHGFGRLFEHPPGGPSVLASPSASDSRLILGALVMLAALVLRLIG